MPEIQNETKKSLGGHLPEKGKPLVVEILLMTPTNNSLVLELWTLTVLDACDTSPARINPTIYNRMTASVLYLFSFHQAGQTGPRDGFLSWCLGLDLWVLYTWVECEINLHSYTIFKNQS